MNYSQIWFPRGAICFGSKFYHHLNASLLQTKSWNIILGSYLKLFPTVLKSKGHLVHMRAAFSTSQFSAQELLWRFIVAGGKQSHVNVDGTKTGPRGNVAASRKKSHTKTRPWGNVAADFRKKSLGPKLGPGAMLLPLKRNPKALPPPSDQSAIPCLTSYPCHTTPMKM